MAEFSNELTVKLKVLFSHSLYLTIIHHVWNQEVIFTRYRIMIRDQ
jgi:hypothetical protein